MKPAAAGRAGGPVGEIAFRPWWDWLTSLRRHDPDQVRRV